MTSTKKMVDSWEKTATDAIGNVIEFWGFKHNHGRIWALLYIHNRPFSANEIQERLNLSKGSVSMMVRELEIWKVLHRVRSENNSTWHFVAETDLIHMITNVVNRRETGIVSRMKQELEKAECEANEIDTIPKDILGRLTKLHNIAILFEEILNIFLTTDDFDIVSLLEMFKEFKNNLSESK